MNTNSASGNWILILFAVAAAVAFVCLFVLPGQASLERLREDVAAAEEFIGEVEAFGSAIEATQQQFDKTEQYVTQWEESSPAEDGLSELFGRINGLAKASGTTTTRFEPQPAIQYDRIRRFPVVMACAGTFGQICEFLRSLEHLEETIWVDELRMEQAGEDSEEVHCELTLAVFADNPGDSDQVDRSE